jgi:hypothetical protein
VNFGPAAAAAPKVAIKYHKVDKIVTNGKVEERIERHKIVTNG